MNKKKVLLYLMYGLTFTNVATYSVPVYAIEKNTEFDYFETEKELIKKYINKKNYELAKKKGREYFINSVDFIFFDKEINGVTWDSLSDSAKQEVFFSFIEIDQLIMKIDPDYKETIGDKYKLFVNYVSPKYLNMVDTIKEAIGDKVYYQLKKKKEKMFCDASELKDKSKVKIKNCYIDYKNKKD